jgi:hypothetical protein
MINLAGWYDAESQKELNVVCRGAHTRSIYGGQAPT